MRTMGADETVLTEIVAHTELGTAITAELDPEAAVAREIYARKVYNQPAMDR